MILRFDVRLDFVGGGPTLEHRLEALGTAGIWFVFDYADYGNVVSAPKTVLQVLGRGATLQQSLLLNLLIFSVFAVPGDFLARIYGPDRPPPAAADRLPGDGPMFLMIALIPGVTTATAPFLLCLGRATSLPNSAPTRPRS